MGNFCAECGRKINDCQGSDECKNFIRFIEEKEKLDIEWTEVIRSINCYSSIQLEIIDKMRKLYPYPPTKIRSNQ